MGTASRIGSGLGTISPQVRTVAFLAIRDWQFKGPVFAGDTIRVKTKVIHKELRGRGKRGEVHWLRTLINQEGKVVQEGVTVTLVENRRPERADTRERAEADDPYDDGHGPLGLLTQDDVADAAEGEQIENHDQDRVLRWLRRIDEITAAGREGTVDVTPRQRAALAVLDARGGSAPIPALAAGGVSAAILASFDVFESKRRVAAREPYRGLLDDPSEAEAMGRRARERVLDEHTYRHRARQLLELIGVTVPA